MHISKYPKRNPGKIPEFIFDMKLRPKNPDMSPNIGVYSLTHFTWLHLLLIMHQASFIHLFYSKRHEQQPALLLAPGTVSRIHMSDPVCGKDQ